MQLSQHSPIYQCQAVDHDTSQQCTRQAIGLRRYNGELYHACTDHLKPEQSYTPVTALPVLTRIWEQGQQHSGKP